MYKEFEYKGCKFIIKVDLNGSLGPFSLTTLHKITVSNIGGLSFFGTIHCIDSNLEENINKIEKDLKELLDRRFDDNSYKPSEAESILINLGFKY